jgi:WD40 repeat protein
MSTPFLPSAERKSIVIAMIVAVVLFLGGALAASAYEAYLVTAADASLNLYNLSTNNLIETITSGLGKSSVVVGPNNRLAFVSTGSILSVIDLTVGREVRRIQGLYIASGSMTFTPDGKWLLFADQAGSGYTYTLDVFDPVRMELVRRVPLAPVMGLGAESIASIVVVGEKAYVTAAYTDQSRPAIAVVDLRSFRARPITIPAGSFHGEYLGTLPNAAATSDGKYVVMVETKSTDYSYHLLLISTMNDRLATDNVLNDDPYGIVVSPVVNPAYGYVVLGSSAIVLDLNNGSSTFGQLLSQTEVDFSQYFPLEYGVAINAEGSRLVVSGFKSSSQGPQPNVVVIDTALMLTNPSQAIVAHTTVANGAQTNAVTIATVTTTSPPTAPTVTGVSGSVTNDTATNIHVFGTNFASGALVRIGSMASLSATVNSSTDLQITVPVNAPAAPALDVIVTNPSVLSPPAQQNQSGLLAAGLNIYATSAFHTTYQFASLNTAGGSVSVFDPSQRAMVNVPLVPPGIAGLTFNADGGDLYSASRGPRYHPSFAEVVALNLGTDSLTPITVPGIRPGLYQALARAINPATGGSVVYEWTSVNGYSDIAVSMVDTNPASPTFNTVIETLNAGLSGSDYYYAEAGTATPDGTFVYVHYLDENTYQYFIAIFDVVHGGPATIISTSTLGIADSQFDMYVTPDGKSLLLQADYGVGGLGIAVFDISANPKNPTLVTTITGTSPSIVGGAGPNFLFSYQVVGNRLFVFSYNNDLLLAFNFDRQHGNYSQLGAYLWQGSSYGNAYIAVSPDGNLIYIAFGGNDMISVYDAAKLVSGQSALITNLASFHGPAVMAVSPVSGSDLLKRGPRTTSGGDQPARRPPTKDE